MYRGLINNRLGDKAGAQADLESALSLNPTDNAVLVAMQVYHIIIYTYRISLYCWSYLSHKVIESIFRRSEYDMA